MPNNATHILNRRGRSFLFLNRRGPLHLQPLSAAERRHRAAVHAFDGHRTADKNRERDVEQGAVADLVAEELLGAPGHGGRHGAGKAGKQLASPGSSSPGSSALATPVSSVTSVLQSTCLYLI